MADGYRRKWVLWEPIVMVRKVTRGDVWLNCHIRWVATDTRLFYKHPAGSINYYVFSQFMLLIAMAFYSNDIVEQTQFVGLVLISFVLLAVRPNMQISSKRHAPLMTSVK